MHSQNMARAKIGVRGSGFGVRGSHVRDSEFAVRSSRFGVRDSGFGVRGSHVRGSGFGVRDSGFGVRDSGFGELSTTDLSYSKGKNKT